ncbi:hypothetical protein K440DRAFT_641936 [Wilcoxina mikolae CBS 423.85]|nr:hypothetical protein K440DRAFT_641936 [Wilcoxina mikolae CBS 423.85]
MNASHPAQGHAIGSETSQRTTPNNRVSNYRRHQLLVDGADNPVFFYGEVLYFLRLSVEGMPRQDVVVLSDSDDESLNSEDTAASSIMDKGREHYLALVQGWVVQKLDEGEGNRRVKFIRLAPKNWAYANGTDSVDMAVPEDSVLVTNEMIERTMSLCNSETEADWAAVAAVLEFHGGWSGITTRAMQFGKLSPMGKIHAHNLPCPVKEVKG